MKRFGGLRFSRLLIGLICLVALAGDIFPPDVLANEQVARRGQTGENGEPPDVEHPCVDNAQIKIQAQPVNIRTGESSQLSWSVELPQGCAGAKIQLAGQEVGRTGSRTVTPLFTREFQLIVSETRFGVNARAYGSTQIEVSYPSHVVINGSTRDPVAVLRGVLTSPSPLNNGQVVPITVELCDVELDLTDHSIVIGSDRSLIASPGCERGPRRLGPRLFIRKPRPAEPPLLKIQGDNVLIAGFRIQGPTAFSGTGNGRKETAIEVWPAPSDIPIRNIEISNMEIYHWSGAAISVVDEQARNERGRLLESNPNAVRIRNNYLHHNRHDAGFGYGVSVGRGAFVLIEHNVFGENRHAIAGDSVSWTRNPPDYSGYIFRDNFILPNGGRHCLESFPYVCVNTHQIDMHGDGDPGSWGCGTAGETIVIERNVILDNIGLAIKIRGNPKKGVIVSNNVFRHSSAGAAIKQNGTCPWVERVGNGLGDRPGTVPNNTRTHPSIITNPIDIQPNNRFMRPRNGPIPDPIEFPEWYRTFTKCDFVGDGQQDTFFATGVTWWAASPVTKQMRYMNTKTEMLSQLQLGDVDGDGRCDVALKPATGQPISQYSKNGTSDWQPAPN